MTTLILIPHHILRSTFLCHLHHHHMWLSLSYILSTDDPSNITQHSLVTIFSLRHNSHLTFHTSHTRTSEHTCARMHTYTRQVSTYCTSTHAHVQGQAIIHACPHIHIRTSEHTCNIHTHTHTHTQFSCKVPGAGL